LYKHFKSKNYIILGALDFYSMIDYSIKQVIEKSQLSAKERIKLYFEMRSEYYESYPSISALSLIQETLDHEELISERNNEIYKSRVEFIRSYIDIGKMSGELRSDIDSEILTDIILGSFREITIKWRMSKYAFSLKEKVISTLDLILQMC